MIWVVMVTLVMMNGHVFHETLDLHTYATPEDCKVAQREVVEILETERELRGQRLKPQWQQEGIESVQVDCVTERPYGN